MRYLPGLFLSSMMLLPAFAGQGAIHVTEVMPPEVAVGDIVRAYGENLNVERVVEVFLTNGKADFKVEVLDQTAMMIRFRVPADAPSGKLRVVVLSNEGFLLEQPVFVRVVPGRRPSSGG
jgi:hypothetical protein